MGQTAEEKLDRLVGKVAKVRRWLVTLAVLKVAVWCMVCVSAYIGIYAWLDHLFNFQQLGRFMALILMLGGLACLIWWLTKSLVKHISYSGAANYIENRRSFNQQLVTAVEYYENKDNYPYSRALAEQLVAQVDKESETFKFDSIVEKWKGYVFAVSILLGVTAVCFYVHDNYVFFSSYFARLVRPLAAVEPLTSTMLKSLTEDIVARPGSLVRFSAEVQGRVPESCKLVLAGVEPQSGDNAPAQEYEQIPTQPSRGGQATPRLEASRFFQEKGLFRYRFEAGSARTGWHAVNICDAPDIKSIVADVSLPARPAGGEWAKTYAEQIENHSLKAIPFSSITLNVQATKSLREAVIIGLDGKSITKQLNGADQFTFSFKAVRTGSIGFRLVGGQGLANDDIPDLEVIAKVDEAPEFKLISPQGDYLATDVASVPITFEVTDDFGLDSVQIILEMPGQEPRTLELPVVKEIRSDKFVHTVELERYDLNVGDSVLFYAGATDIDTGSTPEQRRSSSDVYFIEIRPYRQDWRSGLGGGKGTGASPPDELLNILEYTRAIVKKTWAIVGKTMLTESDRSRLKFIDNDVQYCTAELATMRDDPECGFSEPDKAVLNKVLAHYTGASDHLGKGDASSAVTQEKSAYRVLRKFIFELEKEWKPPSSGQNSQEQKPDSVKLGEPPEFSHYEKERVQGELKRLQQKLEKLTSNQKRLQIDLESFLEQEAEKSKLAKETPSGKSSKADSDTQSKSKDGGKGKGEGSTVQQSKNTPDSSRASDAQKSTASARQSSAKGKGSSSGKGDAKSQSTTQGQSEAASDSAKEQKGGSADQGSRTGQEAGRQGKSSASPGQKQGTGKAGTAGQSTGQSQRLGKTVADAEARLRMFQAKENALHKQVSQLKRDLEKLPATSDRRSTQARLKTQKHLSEALSRMDKLQAKLTETLYQANMNEDKSVEAVVLMEEARRELDQAGKTLETGLEMSEEQRVAKEAQQMAQQLAADADALDESLTPLERRQMLARLEAAKRLLESISPAQWSIVSKGGSSGASHALTQNPQTAPAQQAREMARQFWSIAIDAKKRRTQLTEDEPSDVTFYELENRFFENTAKFDPRQGKK